METGNHTGRGLWYNGGMRVQGISYRSLWTEPPGVVCGIDQTRLPHEFTCFRWQSVADAIAGITQMQVRGAPLIGVAGAFGLALRLAEDASDVALSEAHGALLATRPTAVNLRWALDRVRDRVATLPAARRATAAWQTAVQLADADVATNAAIGRHGLALLQALAVGRAGQPVRVLTHCNAGWLATVDWGTALAPIFMGHDAGLPLHVWVDETRPRMQGLLTAWELAAHGVPHTLIADNAGGHLMQQGEVDLVLVGADRVAANGDVCNKIGTYLKALAAHDNRVPFYAAVPASTFDFSLADGGAIEIEQRPGDELAAIRGRDTAGKPASVRLVDTVTPVANPAFDVTPARLVTGLITQRGVFTPEHLASARAVLQEAA
jgi:methylthioribose-1-phosphate isomerase